MRRVGIVFLITAVLPLSVAAQSMSVEDLYLQQSAEIQVIRDLSSGTERDLKTIALDYIGEIVDRGNANEEVRKILADLSMDGVRNQVRLNGRVMNNYPDLRIRAVNYLAKIGTPEANASLVDILTLSAEGGAALEEDSAVVTAAIKGVASIGLEDDAKSLRVINAVYWRYNTLKPDNALSMAVISAIDSLADKNIRDEGSMGVLVSIQANYEYIGVVRRKAAETISKLRGSGS